MKNKFILLLILFVLFIQDIEARSDLTTNMYSKIYGDSERSIVFIHGGPGYNSFNFEQSAGKTLSSEFKVLIYDQLSCGRSVSGITEEFTFQKAVERLDVLIKNIHNLNKPYLIGHSFGGLIATEYALKYPENISGVILVSAPVDYQLVFESILEKSSIKLKNMPQYLPEIDRIKKINPLSLEFSSSCFMLAMNNGLYSVKNINEKAKEIYSSMLKHPDVRLLNYLSKDPVTGYYGNEKYTSYNISSKLLKINEILPLYFIYGEQDGLFNQKHLTLIKNISKQNNFYLLPGSSHNIFIDEHDKFIVLIKNIIKG